MRQKGFFGYDSDESYKNVSLFNQIWFDLTKDFDSFNQMVCFDQIISFWLQKRLVRIRFG